MANKVRLIDVTKCVACKGCQVACKSWNELPAVKTQFIGSYENPPDLYPETWSRVKFNEYEDNGSIKWYFNFYSCMHCTEAACIDVCPVDAISKNGRGAVRINQDECIGCGACVGVCPFDVPRIGNAKAWKCTFCTERLANNMPTACAKACPTGAITLGSQDEKVAEAEARVSELQAAGVNAQVYGKDELGGLGVVYVLADSPDMYGLPADPQVAASAFLWKVAMGPVKTLAAVGLAAGALSTWFVMRKDMVAKEKEEKERIS